MTEEALNLAVEQRMIRAEFVFMLGGEVENEEVEAEQSSEVQEGLAHRDRRRAHIALTVILQASFGSAPSRATATSCARRPRAARSIRRAGSPALPPAPPAGGATSRCAAESPCGAARGPASRPELAWRARSEFAAGTRVLAEEAIRIDPSSAALRNVATALQRAGAAPCRRVRRRDRQTPMTRITLRLVAIAVAAAVDPSIAINAATRPRIGVVVQDAHVPDATRARDDLLGELRADHDGVPHLVSDAAAAIVIGDRYPADPPATRIRVDVDVDALGAAGRATELRARVGGIDSSTVSHRWTTPDER